MTSFRWDRLDPHNALPEPGDVILTVRVAYRVVEVRPIESRQWYDRWKVSVLRASTRIEFCPRPGQKVWEVSAYRRGEGPEDYATPLALERNEQALRLAKDRQTR